MHFTQHHPALEFVGEGLEEIGAFLLGGEQQSLWELVFHHRIQGLVGHLLDVL